ASQSPKKSSRSWPATPSFANGKTATVWRRRLGGGAGAAAVGVDVDEQAPSPPLTLTTTSSERRAALLRLPSDRRSLCGLDQMLILLEGRAIHRLGIREAVLDLGDFQRTDGLLLVTHHLAVDRDGLSVFHHAEAESLLGAVLTADADDDLAPLDGCDLA